MYLYQVNAGLSNLKCKIIIEERTRSLVTLKLTDSNVAFFIC